MPGSSLRGFLLQRSDGCWLFSPQIHHILAVNGLPVQVWSRESKIFLNALAHRPSLFVGVAITKQKKSAESDAENLFAIVLNEAFAVQNALQFLIGKSYALFQ